VVLPPTDRPRRSFRVLDRFSPTPVAQQNLTVCTHVHTIEAVEVEWDAKKAASNLKKHGVDFADASSVLLDERALTILDDLVDEEDRFVTLGM